MDEIYRLLGKEHQADLEREAVKFRRAAESRGSQGEGASSPEQVRRRSVKRLFRVRVARDVSVGMVLLAATVPFVGAGCGDSSAAKAGTGSQATANVIRATERQRLRALLAHDLDRASKLHANDFELITPTGDVLSKDAYLDSGAAFAYTAWRPITPIRVRVYGDAAVIRYESDLTIHGNRGHDWHTDVYEKRDGRWQVVWSQATDAP